MALKDSYLRLITSQHGKPKLKATMSKLLQYSEDAFAAAIYLDDEFDLDLATGKQQDVLGDIIGIGRTMDFSLGPEHSSVLNDEEYRVLQKAKIIRNLWNGKIEDLYEKWMVLFGTPIRIKDNQDMTLDVLLDINEGSEMQALMKLVSKGLIIPKPMAVRINYQLKYPEIFQSIPIRHKAEILQIVDARHNVWNLGSVRTQRRDGEFNRDGTTRRTGKHPDENYKDRQTHRAEIDLLVESTLTGAHTINRRDRTHCRNGSHQRNGVQQASIIGHCCTITTIKNGIEVIEYV